VKKSPGPAIFRVGAVWHYRFQRGGMRIQRSTGTWDQGKAERIAWREYSGEKAVPTLGELAREWITVHELVVSDSHRRSVTTFSRAYLYGLGDRPIDRIRTEDVESARNLHMVDRAPATVNLWFRILKLLFRWALTRKVISEIPWQVKMIKLQKKPRAILPVEKLMAWLTAVDQTAGARVGIATAIRLMVGIGLREREALTARWEWYSPGRKTYTPGITKGKEADPVPVPDWLVEYLTPLAEAEGLIVESPRGGSYSPGATRKVILRANDACGTPGVSPHRLRGTFASSLAELGVPLTDIQRALRHKDSKTTMGYVEPDMERVATAQAEIARRMGWRKNGGRRDLDADR